MIRKYVNRLFAVLFILWVSFPLLNKYSGLVPDIESRENRALASLPQLNLSQLDHFPAKAEAWFNDRFSVRNYLNRLWGKFSVSVLKKSPSVNAIIGNDGWLFMTKKELDTYLGKNLLTHSELDTLRSIFQKRSQYLKKQGIRYYFVIAPVKYSVYDEYLPVQFRVRAGKIQTDQVVQALKDIDHCTVLDLRQGLNSKAKDSPTPLYYKSDNHWNELGGYWAYNEIIRQIQSDFPELTAPYAIDSFEIRYDSLREGNIANLMNTPELVDEVNPVFRFKYPKVWKGQKRNYPPPKGFPYPYNYEWDDSTSCSSYPKALIIRDSFGKNLRKFLSAHFSETVYLFDSWKYKLHPEIIEQEQPDVFIQICLESYLDHILEYREEF